MQIKHTTSIDVGGGNVICVSDRNRLISFGYSTVVAELVQNGNKFTTVISDNLSGWVCTDSPSKKKKDITCFVLDHT